MTHGPTQPTGAPTDATKPPGQPLAPTHSIARAAALVAAVTVAARVVGFARILVFARTVGPTCLGDAYYTANTVPNILFDVVAGGALTSIVVPLLAGRVANRDDEGADQVGSALLTWSVLLLLPVVVIGIVAAGPLMSLLVGNGHPGCAAAREQDVGARMLVVFMPQVVLYGVGIVLTGILQAHRRFFTPALAPLLSSIVVIGAYLWFAAVSGKRETALIGLMTRHELILSVGTTVGVAVLVLPLLVPMRTTGRRMRPSLRFPPGVASTARRLAVAGAVVIGAQDLATAVILRLANDRGATGAVVLFNLAWTVFLLPWAVLAVPVATATFPTLVARWQDGDADGYATTAARTTRTVLLAAAGAAALMVACAGPAARVVVLGAPGHVPPRDLARAIVAFAPGLLGYALVAHLSRVLYARGNVRTPAVATAVGWVAVVVVDVLLVLALPRSWTAAALGIGTSIGMTLAGAWMAVTLHHASPHALRGAPRTVGAGVVGGVVAAAVGAALAHLIQPGGVAASVVATVVVGAIAAAVFAAGALLLDRTTLALVLRRWGGPRAG